MNVYVNYVKVYFCLQIKSTQVQLNKYEADPYFPQIFHSNTTVCLIISLLCKSCEPICEPEIVIKTFAADFQANPIDISCKK